MTSGFRFDLNLCTGCSACELACSTENQLGWGRSWRQVIPFNKLKLPSLPIYHLSLACNHCSDAPCIKACPALAIQRDEQTGAVLIESQHCIGCKYCSWACPYEAPQFNEQTQVMDKCTWCDHRLAEGRAPACVEQCPTTALTFGALEGVECVPGFPETPADPMIRFEPLREGRLQGPECSWEIPREVVESFAAARPLEGKEISLRSEWPLTIFTLLASVLVGWILASLGRLERPDPRVFLGLATVAAGASTLHLGQKWRAWRAVLNLRHSWLSREITSFSLFVATSLLYSATETLDRLGLVAAIFGVLTLFSVDRVYDRVRPRAGLPVHSADTLLTGILLATLLLGWIPLALAVIAIKLALYMARHVRRLAQNRMAPRMEQAKRPVNIWILPGLRVGLGLVLPVLLWVFGSEAGSLWALPSIAVGEILDRAEFYNELEIASPRRQVVLDEKRLRETIAPG